MTILIWQFENLLSVVELPSSNIHILGPYIYRNAHGNDHGLPPPVYDSRMLLHNALDSICGKYGINYHNFSQILQLDLASSSSLKDRFL